MVSLHGFVPPKNGGEHHLPSVGDERTGVLEHPGGKPCPAPVLLHPLWPHRTPNVTQKKMGQFFNAENSFVRLRQIIFAFHPGIFQYRIGYLQGASAAAHPHHFSRQQLNQFLPVKRWGSHVRAARYHCRYWRRRACTRTPTSSSCSWQFTPREVLPGYHHGRAISSSSPPVSTQAGSNPHRPREPSRSSSEQELLCLCWLG